MLLVSIFAQASIWRARWHGPALRPADARAWASRTTYEKNYLTLRYAASLDQGLNCSDKENGTQQRMQSSGSAIPSIYST